MAMSCHGATADLTRPLTPSLPNLLCGFVSCDGRPYETARVLTSAANVLNDYPDVRLEIQGHVLVGDNARGSVFAFNKFGAGGVLGTSEVTFVSNSQPALPFVSPLGRVDTRAYTPSVAEILQEAFSLDDEAERDPYAHPDSDLRLQVALTKLARSGL